MNDNNTNQINNDTTQININDQINNDSQINNNNQINNNHQINSDDQINNNNQINNNDQTNNNNQINNDEQNNNNKSNDQTDNDTQINNNDQINNNNQINNSDQINNNDQTDNDQINNNNQINNSDQTNNDDQTDNDQINNNNRINNSNQINNNDQTDNDNKEWPDEYIKTIYVHPSFTSCDDKGYKFIKTSDDIELGELLLIEHVYASNFDTCRYIIENNTYLFNMYHPRIKQYSEISKEDKFEHVKNKLSHNCFGYENDQKIMTDSITKINHSCDPNCAVHVQEKYNLNNTNVIFMELFTIRAIKKNAEITICYGPETAHNRDFECKCGKELPERKKRYNITSGLAKTLSMQNNLRIKEKIFKYLESCDAKKILLNHYLSTKGIIINNNTITAYTNDGKTLINNLVYKYLNIGDELLSSSKQIMSESIGNYKISLFLKILNETLLL